MNGRATTTALALQLALVLSAPVSALAPMQAHPAAKPSAPRVVGRIGGEEVTADAFAAFVLDERGTTAAAGEALDALAQERVVEVEAARRGISVDEAAISARYQELDRQVREKTGGKQGIEDFVKTLRHLTTAEFRAKLGKSMLAERMMAEDFGLRAGDVVPPEKQGLWFRDEHRPAITREKLPPGVAAMVGDKPVLRTDWGIHLFGSLPDKEQDDLWKDYAGTLLLLKRGRELALEVTAADIKAEVDERTVLLKQVLENQGMPTDGVDYLATVKARGDDPEVLLKSDKLKAEVLLKKLTLRLYGKDGFKGYYEERRADFDALFGRKVEVATIFLAAAMKKSAKVARTYAEATHELDSLKERLGSDPAALQAAFASQASLHSDDTRSGRAGGKLGFLGAKDLEERGLPAALLDEKSGVLFGPVTTPNGVHLLLVGEKRDASPFEEIRGEVEKAARRKVLEELQKDVKIERNL